MKHTWSDPNKSWGGFRRTKYYLNDRLLSLPLMTGEQGIHNCWRFLQRFHNRPKC